MTLESQWRPSEKSTSSKESSTKTSLSTLFSASSLHFLASSLQFSHFFPPVLGLFAYCFTSTLFHACYKRATLILVLVLQIRQGYFVFEFPWSFSSIPSDFIPLCSSWSDETDSSTSTGMDLTLSWCSHGTRWTSGNSWMPTKTTRCLPFWLCT